MQNVIVEAYNGESIMRSTDLHQLVYNLTGKYEKLGNFHDKVKQVLEKYQDSILLSAQKRSNGYVEYYRLNEIQCNMVMASIDINHLQTLAEFWVSNKSSALTPAPTATMTKEDEIMLPVYEAKRELALKKLALEEEKLALEDKKIALEDKKIKIVHKSELKEIAVAHNSKLKVLKGKHKNAMRKVTQESKAIKQREYVLVDGMKIKADMTVGKIDLPYESLTTLLKKHGRKEHAHEINVILNNMGYVDYVNRVYILTNNAAYYGKNLRSGNTLLPKYYVDYFEELLEEIDSYISKQ
jgi:hypothetical protein